MAVRVRSYIKRNGICVSSHYRGMPKTSYCASLGDEEKEPLPWQIHAVCFAFFIILTWNSESFIPMFFCVGFATAFAYSLLYEQNKKDMEERIRKKREELQNTASQDIKANI